jgi:hypothetical protein
MRRGSSHNDSQEVVMNLNILPINVMLAQSKRWLNDPAMRDPVARHALGQAVLVEVRKAHDRLSMQAERRRQLEVMLASLTERIAAADLRHDRKARAIHAALQGLIEGTDDPVLRQLYLILLQLLFPEGLAIVNRSFGYETGAVEALERRMTAERLADLESIPVGRETLADWYRAWIEAGNDLGKLVSEREVVYTRTGRGGSGVVDVDLRAARLQWVNTIQTYLSTLDLMELGQSDREALLSPLEAEVAHALRDREPGVPGDEPGVPGDEPPGAGPGAGLPGSNPELPPGDIDAAV